MMLMAYVGGRIRQQLSAMLLMWTIASCTTAQTHMVQHPHFLPGLWESYGNVKVFEEWWMPDDSTLVGRSFSVNGNDTLFIEQMELTLRDGSWTFWAKPFNQTNRRAVPFTLTQATEALVFENPEHDYPNRIIYKLSADTLLETRLENMSGNKAKAFSFRKIGCTRL